MITKDTTLADLAVLRAQYGVRHLQLDVKDGMCVATLRTEEHLVRGMSRKGSILPEMEALDDAFARLCHLIGASIAVDGVRTGESARWDL